MDSLAGFTFSIEYQKGRNDAVADALSHVVSKLDAETVKSILDGVIGRADVHDPVVAENDEKIHNQLKKTAVQGMAVHTCVNLHVTDWMAAQQEDPILKIVIEWIATHRVQDLKHLLGNHTTTEEGMAFHSE